jgi:hypothetical protein
MDLRWLLPLIGFFVGSSCVFLWQGRGIVVGFISGLVVGETVAVYAAFVALPHTQHPPSEIYLQNPGFVMAAGLFWTVLCWLGVGLGIPAGLLLREHRNSN